MIGGPALSALAALRTGAGLAVLALPAPIMAAALAIAPSATGFALPVDRSRSLRPSAVAKLLDESVASWDCLAIGPGWGNASPQQQILVRLLAQGPLPMVIDADALNAMSGIADVHRDFNVQAVLTPHPGEYRHLAQHLNIDADPVDSARREDAAAQLARRLGCVVVLKGRHTVVSNGLETVVNETGNVALATGGTGDVLTGMIASLIAQHFKENLGIGDRQVTAEQRGGLSLFDCARIAVWLHGRAADLWAEEHGGAGMLAMDLVNLLPRALREVGG
jgi:NAD(P)H-hydrate epimerase